MAQANRVRLVCAPIAVNFGILKSGALDPIMSDHSGRAELAPFPDWTARYLVHKDPAQRAFVLVPLADVRKAAIGLATEIAEGGPLAVQSTRETMRRGFADGAEEATERELTEQDWTRKTEDFKEGIKSYAEKRVGNFKAR